MICSDKLAEMEASVSLTPQDMLWEERNFWTGPELHDYLAEEKIEKIATEYRESQRLKALIRVYLKQVGLAYVSACSMLDAFDLDTAVGDQLTILGKALGWPRCHCAGQRTPVFGFACDFDSCAVPAVPVGGFCEAEWDCGGPDFVEFCFIDDELYRRFLKARAIALTADYRRPGLLAAARELFGEDAVIWHEDTARVALCTGRLLSSIEISIAHLFRQVLPVAHGVGFELWHSDGPPFGFGAGWGGFCEGHFPAEIPLN